MMLTLSELVLRIRDDGLEVTAEDIAHFVQQTWILPLEEEGNYFFDELDSARIKLIIELRDDMEVNDEALPIVLNLLDQVYGLRQVLEEVREAVQTLPSEHREIFESQLAKIHGPQ
jgi:chaperone modulatory protein CbpM|tara:strand:+ start:9118 stop:9465 length:348 start_codon:yes stop_codon:yes gene_type:complete